jgi:hypothetical protein
MTINAEKTRLNKLVDEIEAIGLKFTKAMLAGHPIGGLLSDLEKAINRKADKNYPEVKEAIKRFEVVNDNVWRRGKDPQMIVNKVRTIVSLATKPYKKAVHA